MLNYFRKTPTKSAVAADLEETLLKTFGRLVDASALPDSLPRRFSVIAALAACSGAIREAYPNLLSNEDNITTALLDANVRFLQDEADALADALHDIVRDCPNDRDEQTSSVLWMLSPSLGRQARDVIRSK